MKPYNYSLVEEYQSKIVIPYTGIEIKGWSNIIAGLIGTFTGTFVLGVPFSFVLGSNGFFLSFAITIASVMFLISYANEINNETGKNKMSEFYYVSIKKYRKVYDQFGEEHYILPKKEGVIFVNARRKNTHL